MTAVCSSVVAGRAIVHVTAENFGPITLDVEGTWSVKPGTLTREARDGQGFTLNEANSYVEGDLTDSGSLDLLALQNLCSATVTVRMIHGTAYTLRDATVVGEVSTNTDGSVTIRFESRHAAAVALNNNT